MAEVPLALIIEDDTRLADIFTMVLQDAAYETKTAIDGQMALNYLTYLVPDLVILDLHLPHASGMEILRHIRSQARLASVPVILATADVRMADMLRGDADLVLLKPISPTQLRGMASRLRPQQPFFAAASLTGV